MVEVEEDEEVEEEEEGYEAQEEEEEDEGQVLKRPAARVIDDMPGAPRKRPATAAAEGPAPSAPRPRYTLMFYKASGAYAVRDKESGNQIFQVQVPGVPDGKSEGRSGEGP